jgi:hypothetical protein
MKRFFFLILLIDIAAFCAANNIVRISAIYEYASNNPNETPAQAEAMAFEKARIKALEDKFGIDVYGITKTLITNRVDNSGVKSQNSVFALGETSVRGEWVETIKEKVIEKNFISGFWIIKVYVEGRARNHSTEKANIQFSLVRNVQDIETPITFRDGSDVFLRFISPVGGYLCVYLVDEEQNTFCLLPYPNQQYGSQPIEANKDYIFFSSDYEKDAQEYTLNCQKSSEQNALYVIFSPNNFTKAVDKQGGTNFRDEPLPRELKYEDFLKWLGRNQAKDADMVVKTDVITIKK